MRLAKSPVYSTYPLTYVEAFNFHPQEVGPDADVLLPLRHEAKGILFTSPI